jgi:hypothetical protein
MRNGSNREGEIEGWKIKATNPVTVSVNGGEAEKLWPNAPMAQWPSGPSNLLFVWLSIGLRNFVEISPRSYGVPYTPSSILRTPYTSAIQIIGSRSFHPPHHATSSWTIELLSTGSSHSLCLPLCSLRGTSTESISQPRCSLSAHTLSSKNGFHMPLVSQWSWGAGKSSVAVCSLQHINSRSITLIAFYRIAQSAQSGLVPGVRAQGKDNSVS